jgi:uncharacterized protein with GYD domain
MATFVMLTRLSPEAVAEPRAFEQLSQQVTEKIKAQCPEVKWLGNYAVLGPYDYVDIFEAPDTETATKVAVIIRSFGHATTETWAATPWERFRELVRTIS